MKKKKRVLFLDVWLPSEDSDSDIRSPLEPRRIWAMNKLFGYIADFVAQ